MTELRTQVYRENICYAGFWFKLLFTLGLYIFWWHARKLVVDQNRVTYSSGVLSKLEKSIPLNQVQDVALYRPLLGRLLGYGDIYIESAGSKSTRIIFLNVANPEK